MHFHTVFIYPYPLSFNILKMFSKLAIIAVATFTAVAAAAPWEQIKREPSYAGQCSTGTQQCCDKVQNADAPQAAQALGSLGLQVAADVLVGLTCTPITVIGVAGSSCSQQPVCCNNNNFNGVVALGCIPDPSL